jgi:ribosomal protein S18 acetylase RimI-like enzyme
MYSKPNYKFLSKGTITEKDYSELNDLLKICQEVGPVNVKLELDYKLSHSRSVTSTNQKITEFFCYAGDTLISYLGICNFGGELNEVTGLTHPMWRRQHIFNQLLQMAITEMKKDNQTKFLLLTDNDSTSGTAFITSIGATYSISEYGMKLEHYTPTSKEHQVHLMKAQAGDLKKINKLDHTLFADHLLEETDEEERIDKIPIDSSYLIYQDSNLIGKICVDISDSYAFIYGFGIMNEYRGKGFGTQALLETIGLIHSKGLTNIGLDVAATNERALHIYTSCGFVKQSVMDYYELDI